MPLLLVFCTASFLVATASPSELNVMIDHKNRSNEDVPWPLSPARGLLSSMPGRGFLGRGLQEGAKGPCVRSLLAVAEPETLKKWGECVETKVQSMSSDNHYAGSIFGAYLDCWCDNKVEQVLEEFGCCNHIDFHMLCEAECPAERNCATEEAITCMKNCPAVCLESDYAPEFCGEGCAPCLKYMGCVVENSANMTKVGHPEHSFICNDYAFDQSTQWDSWKTCYAEHPKRTHWHRHNAEHYCYCESQLKTAAQEHNCCDAAWGKRICDEKCETAAQNIDCASTEAQTCMTECNQICQELYKETISTDCQQKCIDTAGQCAKYSICKPTGPFEFDYVCDDGSKPYDNGCCLLHQSQLGCPVLCDSWAPHLPMHSVAGYELEHGWECQCNGCPDSIQQAKDKWRATLINDLEQHGVLTLAALSKEVGILGANRKMQELMKERNEKIMAAYEDHPGVPDEAFQVKVNAIVEDYHGRILLEAERFKANGEIDDYTGTVVASGGGSGNVAQNPQAPPASTDKAADKAVEDSSDGDNTVMIIGAAAGAGGLLLLVIIIILVYRLKAKHATPAGARNPGAAAAAPYDGDSNVVMGRPIEGGAGAEATQGAPIQQGGKGQGDPEKDPKAI